MITRTRFRQPLRDKKSAEDKEFVARRVVQDLVIYSLVKGMGDEELKDAILNCDVQWVDKHIRSKSQTPPSDLKECLEELMDMYLPDAEAEDEEIKEAVVHELVQNERARRGGARKKRTAKKRTTKK